MRNFQDTFETRKRSFISAFSICMTLPLSSCQVVILDIPQDFSSFLYLFLELKYKKYCNFLSCNYFLFTFDRKCLKIIVFSSRDGLKMNRSSIELGKKWHCGYMQLLLWRCQRCQYGGGCFKGTHERQNAYRKVSFWPVH